MLASIEYELSRLIFRPIDRCFVVLGCGCTESRRGLGSIAQVYDPESWIDTVEDPSVFDSPPTICKAPPAGQDLTWKELCMGPFSV